MVDLDKVKGCLYGQAIGDALGIYTESMFKKNIDFPVLEYRCKFSEEDLYAGYGWNLGAWSDDTDQALCILRSYLDCKKLDVLDLADKFYNWYKTDGRGIGNLTFKVLTHPSYDFDPIAVSKEIWEESCRKVASNGAIMRISVVGLLDEDINWVRDTASTIASMTHYDPRCVTSSAIISMFVCYLIQNKSIDDIVCNISIDDEISQLMNRDLRELDLDEENSQGYTYKTFGAAIWALREYVKDPINNTFDKIIHKIILEGGDTDTNAAVAGALLGAAMGYSNIPEYLIEGLKNKHILDKYLQELVEVKGYGSNV